MLFWFPHSHECMVESKRMDKNSLQHSPLLREIGGLIFGEVIELVMIIKLTFGKSF